MRKSALFALAVVALAVSCRRSSEPVIQLPDLQRGDVRNVVLTQSDLGPDWETDPDPSPNTVQIGGRVGAANVRPARAESSTAFRQKDGSGYVSNSVYLLRTEAMAAAVLGAHQEAARRGPWTQERDDGGRTAFSYTGSVENLSSLGDEVFAARLKAAVTDAADNTTESIIEYVTYRVGPLVGFVVAENVGAATFASRQEAKVARLLTR